MSIIDLIEAERARFEQSTPVGQRPQRLMLGRKQADAFKVWAGNFIWSKAPKTGTTAEYDGIPIVETDNDDQLEFE